mmetsp:Transcript_17879/g.50831  ORF Transcript_17879/g.50831 Transcript_17879/m.50831 type:complete len:233 (-) Transcript_17879:273-971(-)
MYSCPSLVLRVVSVLAVPSGSVHFSVTMVSCLPLTLRCATLLLSPEDDPPENEEKGENVENDDENGGERGERGSGVVTRRERGERRERGPPRAGERPAPSPATECRKWVIGPFEHVLKSLEEVFEHLVGLGEAEVVRSAEVKAASTASEGGVVLFPLVGVAEGLVCLGNADEPLRGLLLVTLVLVRVIRFLDLPDAQHVIVDLLLLARQRQEGTDAQQDAEEQTEMRCWKRH